jgi:hypothetical protein
MSAVAALTPVPTGTVHSGVSFFTQLPTGLVQNVLPQQLDRLSSMLMAYGAAELISLRLLISMPSAPGIAVAYALQPVLDTAPTGFNQIANMPLGGYASPGVSVGGPIELDLTPWLTQNDLSPVLKGTLMAGTQFRICTGLTGTLPGGAPVVVVRVAWSFRGICTA